MKRFLLSLLALLGLGYAAAVLFGLYLAITAGQGKWEQVEPWFGAKPEVVRSRNQTDFGSAWLVKADETWVSELARRLHPGRSRRLLWYLLPLLHALYLCGFLYLLHREEQDCACNELPLLLPAPAWCAFSLLQSATSDAAVALVRNFRSRHA